jgi:hypothetical protein
MLTDRHDKGNKCTYKLHPFNSFNHIWIESLVLKWLHQEGKVFICWVPNEMVFMKDRG